MNIPLLRAAALTLLAAPVLWSQTANRTFTAQYSFGDSLSDTGNLFAATSALGAPNPPAPYFQGRFANGPVWTELLGTTPALAVTAPPSARTSLNFAVGGATAAGSSQLPPSLGVQVAQFVQRGITPAPTDLFTVLAGANDLIPALGSPATATNPASLDTAGIATAQVVAGQVQALVARGARNLVVGGLPNLGRTPRALAAGGVAGAGFTFGNRASTAFNQELRARLSLVAASAPDLNLVFVDLQGIVDRIAESGAALGFTNTTSFFLAPAAQGGGQGNPNGYVFWDDIHPTARTHAILAGIVNEQLNPERARGLTATQGSAAIELAGLGRAALEGRT
ncbi:MAG: SGNH/GDSL hydrolase family protein, partial [Verrucomicrobiota bacterium]